MSRTLERANYVKLYRDPSTDTVKIFDYVRRSIGTIATRSLRAAVLEFLKTHDPEDVYAIQTEREDSRKVITIWFLEEVQERDHENVERVSSRAER